jgi:hypothetical protein
MSELKLRPPKAEPTNQRKSKPKRPRQEAAEKQSPRFARYDRLLCSAERWRGYELSRISGNVRRVVMFLVRLSLART